MTSIIFAKHAQHVVLIHFPIALFLTAVAFDYYAQWAKDKSVASAAYLNLLLAAVTTVPVLATGLAAWAWALEGQRLKGTLLMHLVLGIASSALICATYWIHWRAGRSPTGTVSSAGPNVKLSILMSLAAGAGCALTATAAAVTRQDSAIAPARNTYAVVLLFMMRPSRE